MTVAILAAGFACRETDFGPDASPENGVLNIRFEAQTGSARIYSFPVQEKDSMNRIELSLRPDADFRRVVLRSVTVSMDAVSSLKPGDAVDMTRVASFTVTAANGLVRTYHILPPEPFDVSRQGPALTISGVTRSHGEWLCLGQNKTADTYGGMSPVGFFRCFASNGVRVDSNLDGAAGLLHPAQAFDGDDYFIFYPNGLYEFSYGKNRNSSAVADTLASGSPLPVDYRRYLLKQSRGYWSIVDSYRQNNPANTGTGLSLTDGTTGVEYLFNMVSITATNVLLRSWPGTGASPRISYNFPLAGADADWQNTWIAD
jgi:hypothetical protein